MMKYIFLFLASTLLLNCTKDTRNYDCNGAPNRYGNQHLLRIPYTFTPNRLIYKIGDTITITSNFDNEIEDISFEKFFTIDSALLRPIMTIRRFDADGTNTKVSGPYNVLVDPEYDPYYGNSIHSYIRYKDKSYHWTNKIVLRKKGKYILTIEDTSINSFEEMLITSGYLAFPERCAGRIFIGNMVEGDDHMKELEPELIYYDKKILGDRMRSFYDLNSTGVFGSGSYSWELEGTYGFIVE
jgi:hypothetical protein